MLEHGAEPRWLPRWSVDSSPAIHACTYVCSSHRGGSCRHVCVPARSTSSSARSASFQQVDEFDCLSLSVQDTLIVGRVGHPLGVVDEVTVADVLAYPLVGPGLDSDAAELLAGLASAISDDPARSATQLLTVECDNSEVLKRVLVETDALTFMPRYLVESDLQEGRLAVVGEFDIGLRVRIGAAWLRGRSLGGAGSAFLDLLRATDQPDEGCADTDLA